MVIMGASWMHPPLFVSRETYTKSSEDLQHLAATVPKRAAANAAKSFFKYTLLIPARTACIPTAIV